MLFTKASEYALLASIYLSKQKQAQDVEKMAAELELSKAFLAKVLQLLAKDGILKSFKGAGGGFILAKNPEQITLDSIIQSAEKRKVKVFDCSDGKAPCSAQKAGKCQALPMFVALQGKVDDFLSTMSLADLNK